MAGSLLIVLLALLLALPVAVDYGHGGSLSWESDDDTSAAIVLEDGVATGPVVTLAGPALAATAQPLPEPSASPRQSLPSTPGRAPPAC